MTYTLIRPKTDEDTPWTRLKGTSAWSIVKSTYGHNGLPYHSFEHVRAIYGWAESLGIPYSKSLDESILFHDVIWDGKGNHEDRSIQFYAAVTGEFNEKTVSYIDATKTHNPLHPGAVMALLDIADFVCPVQTQKNSAMLFREAKKHRSPSLAKPTWMKNNCKYLYSLAATIGKNLHDTPEHTQVWRDVKAGIEATITRHKVSLQELQEAA